MDTRLPIRQLVYISAATEPLSSSALEDIGRHARAQNRSSDITGVLFYRDARFMQLIEGQSAAIEALYGRISQDSRHTDLLVVLDRRHDDRACPDWNMAIVNLDGETALTASALDRIEPWMEGKADAKRSPFELLLEFVTPTNQ